MFMMVLKSIQWTFANIHRYVNMGAHPHRQAQNLHALKNPYPDITDDYV